MSDEDYKDREGAWVALVCLVLAATICTVLLKVVEAW